MKAAILALVLTVAGAQVHIRFAVLGVPVSLPVVWLLLAAEVLAAAGGAVLVARKLRGFRPPLFVMARRAAPWTA